MRQRRFLQFKNPKRKRERGAQRLKEIKETHQPTAKYRPYLDPDSNKTNVKELRTSNEPDPPGQGGRKDSALHVTYWPHGSAFAQKSPYFLKIHTNIYK